MFKVEIKTLTLKISDIDVFICIICVTIIQVLVKHLFATLFPLIVDLLNLVFVLSPIPRDFPVTITFSHREHLQLTVHS